VSEAGRCRRSFAFAAANCAGRENQRSSRLQRKALTMAACRAGKRASRLEAKRAYSAAGVRLGARTRGRRRRSGGLGPVERDAHRDNGLAETVSVANSALSAAKAAACLTEGALTGTGRLGGGT